jgi:DNA-binding XRE family transcriptional regulator
MPMRTKPPHEPTPEGRQLVQLHATIGTTQETIADILGIDAKTLRKHYRDELTQSMAKANATIGGALFNKAKGGDTTAMIFWMKTRAGWKEPQRIEMTGADGGPILTETTVPDDLRTALDAIAGKIAGGNSAG